MGPFLHWHPGDGQLGASCSVWTVWHLLSLPSPESSNILKLTSDLSIGKGVSLDPASVFFFILGFY